MHRFSPITFLSLLGAALACGSGQIPSDTVAQGSDGEPRSLTVPAEVVYSENPNLVMQVQGPDPSPGEFLETDAPDDYQASIVVRNTGTAPAIVEYAGIFFEVDREGEFIRCDPPSEQRFVTGPRALEPGQAHTYIAQVHCPFPGPGNYQIRAFVSFGAEVGPYDLERHYAGTYAVTVR